MLPLIVAVAVMLLFRRGKKLPLTAVSLLAAGVLLFILLPQEAVRPGGLSEGSSFESRVAETMADPSIAIEQLFSSQSTSMQAALAMGIGDASSAGMPLGWGAFTAAETVLQPVPQQLWPTKPESIRNTLIDYRFGLGDAGCLSLCPTYGPVMSFYADWGLAGAVVGGVFIALLASGWTRITLCRRDIYGLIAYCATFWGFAYMWWSSVSALTISLLFFGVPLVLARLISRRRFDLHVPGGRSRLSRPYSRELR